MVNEDNFRFTEVKFEKVEFIQCLMSVAACDSVNKDRSDVFCGEVKSIEVHDVTEGEHVEDKQEGTKH